MVPVVILEPEGEDRDNLCLLLEAAGLPLCLFDDPKSYFDDEVFLTAHLTVMAFQQVGFSGTDVIRHVVSQSACNAVIAVLEKPNTRATVAAMLAGARDVVERPVPADPIIKLCIMGQAGEGLPLVRLNGAASTLQQLTKREREVLQQLLGGKSNKDIASDLGVSIRTIESHRARIYDKLQVNSQAELIRKWNT